MKEKSVSHKRPGNDNGGFGVVVAKCPHCGKRNVKMAHVRWHTGWGRRFPDTKTTPTTPASPPITEAPEAPVAPVAPAVPVAVAAAPAAPAPPAASAAPAVRKTSFTPRAVAERDTKDFVKSVSDELGGRKAPDAKPAASTPADDAVQVRGDTPKSFFTSKRLVIALGCIVGAAIAINLWRAWQRRQRGNEQEAQESKSRADRQQAQIEAANAAPLAWNPEMGGIDNPAAYINHEPSRWANEMDLRTGGRK